MSGFMKRMSQSFLDAIGHNPYQGPFLDGTKATGMEVAYVEQRVGPPQKLYKPYPSNDVINAVLGANGPEYALQAALADGSYVPSAQVKAVEAAYKAWTAAKHPDGK